MVSVRCGEALVAAEICRAHAARPPL